MIRTWVPTQARARVEIGKCHLYPTEGFSRSVWEMSEKTRANKGPPVERIDPNAVLDACGASSLKDATEFGNQREEGKSARTKPKTKHLRKNPRAGQV